MLPRDVEVDEVVAEVIADRELYSGESTGRDVEGNAARDLLDEGDRNVEAIPGLRVECVLVKRLDVGIQAGVLRRSS